MYAHKSVEIRGNLNQQLKYRLCPSNEFAIGDWQIAISSILCEASNPLDTFISISTNFSVKQRFSTAGQTEYYQQPLASFHLKTYAGNFKVKKEPAPLWLEINRTSDYLYLDFIDPLNNSKPQADVKIVISLLFRRVA